MGFHGIGDVEQNLVSGLMAVGIVDTLEMIDVEQNDGEFGRE
jgi:hypothetical protein